MKNKQHYDVQLPPYKVQKPNMFLRALNLVDMNNWAYSYLKVDINEPKLLTSAKRKINVFVLDTAGRLDNKYLADYVNNELGVDFTNDPEPKDLKGHGTHVAGCIAAAHNDYVLGAASLLKGKIQIIPVKVLNKDGSGTYNWIQKGIEYVRNTEVEGIKLVNMSFGGTTSSSTIQNLIVDMMNKGEAFFFAAAGNSGYDPQRDTVDFPGRIPGLIASGALDKNSTRAYFSGVGQALDVISPGVDIWSTYLNDQLAKFNGTSMGSPITVSIAAWLLSINEDIKTQAQFNEFFFKYITDLGNAGWDKFYGHGVSVIEPYLSEEPSDPPSPPPPVEEDEKEVILPLDATFATRYKHASESDYHWLYLNLTLKVTTSKFTEVEYRHWLEYFTEYFKRRGYIFSKPSDIYKVGYYINSFWEIFDEKGEYGADIYEMIVTDEKGNKVLLERPNELVAPTSLDIISKYVTEEKFGK